METIQELGVPVLFHTGDMHGITCTPSGSRPRKGFPGGHLHHRPRRCARIPRRSHPGHEARPKPRH
jgi:hypothetical protein